MHGRTIQCNLRPLLLPPQSEADGQSYCSLAVGIARARSRFRKVFDSFGTVPGFSAPATLTHTRQLPPPLQADHTEVETATRAAERGDAESRLPQAVEELLRHGLEHVERIAVAAGCGSSFRTQSSCHY